MSERTTDIGGEFAGLGRKLHLEDGALISETVQDCTPIAERAKELHNIGYAGHSDMKLAASIPFVMVEKYLNDNRITFQEFCNDSAHQKRLITDPALKHFRVWNGAL